MFKTVVYSNVYLIDNILEGTIEVEKEVGDEKFNEEINHLHNEYYDKGYEYVNMSVTSSVNKHGFMCIKAFITYRKMK